MAAKAKAKKAIKAKKDSRAPPASIDGPVILAGQAISSAFPIGAGQPLVLLMPDDWTGPANLKCAYSADGINFYQLYHSGKEWICPCIPNTAWVLETNAWPPNSYIKLTTVFAGQPVIQEADRAIQIVTAKQIAAR